VRGKRNKERVAYVVDSGAGSALADWLTVRGDAPGPLFCATRQGGSRITEPLHRLAPVTVRQRALAHRAVEARVPHLTPHDFRRTHIGDLLDAGVDVVTVSKMVGHARVETTARYDRRGERAKQTAAAQLRVPYRARGRTTGVSA
jgi:integrase